MENDEIKLRDIIVTVYNHRKTFLITLLSGMLVTIAAVGIIQYQQPVSIAQEVHLAHYTKAHSILHNDISTSLSKQGDLSINETSHLNATENDTNQTGIQPAAFVVTAMKPYAQQIITQQNLLDLKIDAKTAKENIITLNALVRSSSKQNRARANSAFNNLIKQINATEQSEIASKRSVLSEKITAEKTKLDQLKKNSSYSGNHVGGLKATTLTLQKALKVMYTSQIIQSQQNIIQYQQALQSIRPTVAIGSNYIDKQPPSKSAFIIVMGFIFSALLGLAIIGIKESLADKK